MSVWNGGLTESTALGAFISHLHRILIKKKKCKNKSSVATAASSVALHGLPKADAGRGSNTDPGTAKPVAPFHL